MKKLILIVFMCLNYVVFAQSDLGFQSYYAGSPGATHFKGEEIDWAFTAINSGNANANIVDYKIVLSQDQNFDTSDILLIDGKIGGNWLNLTGLDVGQTINHSSVNKVTIQIPLSIEANKTYYFIFWIEQDIAGGETNVANNVVTQSVFIGFTNKVSVVAKDGSPLGIRRPLLLIHGWQPNGNPASPDTTIWNNFVAYYDNDQELKDNFKVYYVRYYSNWISIDDIGHELRYDLDAITEFQGKQLSIVAHSMGGLVARSFMNRSIGSGSYANQKGGARVEKLITLGTPHHGSPMSNGLVRQTALPNSFDLNLLTRFDILFSPIQYYELNRSNMFWDNYRNPDLFDYVEYSEEKNNWLTSSKMNADTEFDSKIIAYAGSYTALDIPIPIVDNYVGLDTFGAYGLGDITMRIMWSINYSISETNDGIVPISSALFYDHNIQNTRYFPLYNHTRIAKGKNNEDLDGGLFHTIKTDLLDFTNTPILLSTSTSTLQFPEVLENTAYQKTFNLSNTGSMDLTVSSIDITGVDLNQFNIISPTAPFNIVVNDSVNVVVQFNPTSIGEKNALLTITNNSINSPTKEITLNGIGVDTATSILAFSPNTSYDFEEVYIYGGSTSNSFFFSNQGTSDITITNIEINGVDASLFSILNTIAFPVVVKSGVYSYFYVAFEPDTVGIKNAELVITNDSSNSPSHSISLTGTGTDVSNDPNANKTTTYEYWFDNDYASKVSTSVTALSTLTINPNIDVSNINEGLHTFHIRFKDSQGQWSSVLSEYINRRKIETNNNLITSYRYWFNTEDNQMKNVDVSPDVAVLNLDELIDISGLVPNGNNYIHFQFRDINGNWSSVTNDEFYLCGTIVVPTITVEGNLLTASNSTSYQWFLEGNIIAGATNQTYEATESGIYTVVITNENGCAATSEDYLHISLSVTDEDSYDFKIFPNPTKAEVYLISDIKDGTLEIYNLLGQLINSFQKMPSKIDISNYDAGVYIFIIKSENMILQERQIKF